MNVHANEVSSFLGAFCTFYFIIFSHYLVVPLRDEAGVALGTRNLPVIFLCSLVAALAAAPITSYFLSRPGVPKEKGIQQLYMSMSCLLGGFYVLYTVAFGSGPDNLQSIHPSVSGRQDEIPSLITTGDRGQGIAKGVHVHTEEHIELGNNELTSFARAVHFLFFLWVGVQSISSMSAVWARCADIFSRDAALRLYGFIAGGGTLGQLSGSFLARFIAKSKNSADQSSLPPYVLVIIACFTMLLASMISQKMRPIGDVNVTSSPKNDHSISNGLQGRLLESFKMIFSSGYLLHLCLFLVLTYCIASLYYFERSLVVAMSLQDSNARTAWFATVNVYSSTIVATIQLTATGRILKFLGLPLALCALPIFACLGFFMVFISPSPDVIMAAEVMRKVLMSAVARPAREGLYSVLSTDEKYKAKVFIDMIIQRLGDTIGAGIFQAIEGIFALGPRTVAGVGMTICCFWVYTALSLGRRNLSLAHQREGG